MSRSGARRDARQRVVIGVSSIAGALVWTYFSATPTLTCRPGSDHVECSLTAKALGIEVSRQHVTGVRSVMLAPAVMPGPFAAPRLMFRDGAGDRPLGYFSVHFVNQAGELDEFVRKPTPAGLRITPPPKLRTLLARIAAVGLGAIGVLVLLSAIRGRP